MLIAVKKNKFIVLFMIIFGTLSFSMSVHLKKKVVQLPFEADDADGEDEQANEQRQSCNDDERKTCTRRVSRPSSSSSS